jgi:hypothetical protein
MRGTFALADLAQRFGLSNQAEVYARVDISDAASIATGILSRDLAYDTEIMSQARAAALWQQFLRLFDGQKIHLFSNARSGLRQWTPATDATFDMGVLIVGESRSGCLWIEDED